MIAGPLARRPGAALQHRRRRSNGSTHQPEAYKGQRVHLEFTADRQHRLRRGSWSCRRTHRLPRTIRPIRSRELLWTMLGARRPTLAGGAIRTAVRRPIDRQPRQTSSGIGRDCRRLANWFMQHRDLFMLADSKKRTSSLTPTPHPGRTEETAGPDQARFAAGPGHAGRQRQWMNTSSSAAAQGRPATGAAPLPRALAGPNR